MPDAKSLLPPLPVIAARLTQNQRERSFLRALFRLALRAAEEQTDPSHPQSCPEADGRNDPALTDRALSELGAPGFRIRPVKPRSHGKGGRR